MNRALLIAVILVMAGCTFNVKTPIVANYDNLDLIEKNTSRNDIAVFLGTPQGIGVYGQKDALNELQFYYGFAGKFTLSGADYDSGTAFISYKENAPIDIIYFNSKITGKEIPRNNNLNIKAIADSLQLGKSSIDDLIKVLGNSAYNGRRINVPSNIFHSIAYWDASTLQPNGAIKEKWLLVGYDKNRIVQDFIWISSNLEDIKEFGQVSEQQIKQMSRTYLAGFVPIMEATGIDTGTKIDPMQVNALIQTNPKNIKDIINVLGKPSALGIKSFEGSESLSMSNWSFSKIKLEGDESNFVPASATEQQRKELAGTKFKVMSLEQSRLMIGHSADGEIKEILWTHPIK